MAMHRIPGTRTRVADAPPRLRPRSPRTADVRRPWPGTNRVRRRASNPCEDLWYSLIDTRAHAGRRARRRLRVAREPVPAIHTNSRPVSRGDTRRCAGHAEG